jgi:predicted negative regulator of RcsB-dependent stress response
MERDPGGPVATIARERLARVLLDQGQAQQALELIDAAGANNGFEARFAEVRGDILLALDDAEGARAAYQEALDMLEAGTGNRQLLELKRDHLASAGDAQEPGES